MLPLSPGAPQAEVTEFWRSHSTSIRFGVVLMVLGATLGTGIPAAFAALVRRCEGRGSVLAYFEVQLGAINFAFAAAFMVFFGAVAFREQEPATYQFWTDVLWLMLLGTPFLGDTQMVIIAVAAFRDRTRRIFPRWYAWYSLWQAFITAPAALVFFMPHGGMFGYNGGMSFYFIVGLFVIWIGITTSVCWHAAGRAYTNDQAIPLERNALDQALAMESSTV